MIIGEKAFWGRGYGTDAITLAVGYGLQDLGLRRVHLLADADNTRAIRCYEKVGFVREGLLRQHRMVGGRAGDTVIMGLLRDEWRRE